MPVLIGVSEDLLDRNGRPQMPGLDLGARLADRGDVVVRSFPVPPSRTADPDDVSPFEVLVLGDCSLGAEAIAAAPKLRHIARLGKGYDDIDVAAASKRGIVVTNVVDAGDTAMATGVMTLLLALASRLVAKHEIARAGASAWGFPLAYAGIGPKAAASASSGSGGSEAKWRGWRRRSG